MTARRMAGTLVLALTLLATVAGLAGCASIDESLGGGTEQAAQPPANAQAAPEPGPAPYSVAPETATPEAAAPETAAAGTPAPAPAPVITAAAPPPAAGIAPVTVQPGNDTGTAVGHTLASLRAQLQSLENKIGADAQRLAEVKNGSAQATATYQQMRANIETRLAVGTTPGNPELINQWNTAQGALDTMTGNINTLSKLANDITADSSAVHSEYESVQAASNVSGAVDEDQRQLNVLSDETSQTVIVVDRLMKDMRQAIQRQTAFVANERGNLTKLAAAIRAGDYTAAMTGAPVRAMAPTAAAPPAAARMAAEPLPAGAPIVTIKFDRAHVAYEQTLYSALTQALTAQPKASFSVIGVAPQATRVAENSAERNAKAVMRTMGQMGVPPARMAVSASTDPAISASEVRVYVK
jgi:hypothetical protein